MHKRNYGGCQDASIRARPLLALASQAGCHGADQVHGRPKKQTHRTSRLRTLGEQTYPTLRATSSPSCVSDPSQVLTEIPNRNAVAIHRGTATGVSKTEESV